MDDDGMQVIGVLVQWPDKGYTGARPIRRFHRFRWPAADPLIACCHLPTTDCPLWTVDCQRSAILGRTPDDAG